MHSSNKKIKILHITPWFPTSSDPTNAIFIQRHIQSLEPWCEQTVLHIDLKMQGENIESENLEGVIHVQKKMIIKSWKLLEWTFYRLLKKQLKALNARENFTHVNFHIAYPLMVYYKRLEKWLPQKKVITEHWSAYHFNFSSIRKHERLTRIFHHGIPILAVSETLASDIKKFSRKDLEVKILPNVIDDTFYYSEHTKSENHFLSVALWKFPKKPLDLLLAIKKMRDDAIPVKLRLGGYGPYVKEMIAFIETHHLEEQVTFIGKIKATDMAEEMRKAKAFILPTGYETFSALLAEALCCGRPVIANDVGAVSEIVNNTNGLLVKTDWISAIKQIDQISFDHKKIAENARGQFSMETVGKKYFTFLLELK